MKASENNLLQLLSNNEVTFFIPPYQRNYEWDFSQCEVFFNDVVKTATEKTEHFFGSIVYVETERVFGQPVKLVLTDGQQRITTTMLFLLAFRDVVENEQTKKFIESKYLKNENVPDDTEYKIKLKQVESDWEVYRNLILREDVSERDKGSSVYKNYQYFKNCLNRIKKNNEINLPELISDGIAKFSIVTIQLEPSRNSWENPQEIFESMNSLGKPLSLADLVRNYLLLGKNAEEQDKLYRDYWLSMERNLPDQLSNFIRDYMQLIGEKDYKKATASNYKELYSQFKDLFKEREAGELIKQLKKFSRYYSYIVLGSSSGHRKIDSKLADLRLINVTTIYSFILKIFEKLDARELSDDNVVEILETIIIYILRRRILKLTQAENKNFPVLVKQIDRLINAANKKEEMFNIFSEQENALRIPNDIEVENALKTLNFYNFKQGKFILSLIEEKITKSRPDRLDKTLQIEHIMPQKLNEYWKEELGEEFNENIHGELVHYIGNLTLIRHNQELGNKSFKEKKKIYTESSGLQIAMKEITNRDRWNQDSIENRGKWIIEYLLEKVLVIPDRMRRRNNFRTTSRRLSFYELGLVGETINYISDKSISAKVINNLDVEFEGRIWRLSPLTKELETRIRGENNSTFQGSQYWEYDGIRLSDIY